MGTDSADHLKRAERPPGRFWDEAQPAAAPTPAASPTAPQSVPAAAPAPAGMSELLAFMTAQTALMQELLSQQRRLRQRIDELEKAPAMRDDHSV